MTISSSAKKMKVRIRTPMVVMVDEETGEKYARGVSQKGIGEDGEMKWLIDDMQRELKSWGYPGGDNSHLIFQI